MNNEEIKEQLATLRAKQNEILEFVSLLRTEVDQRASVAAVSPGESKKIEEGKLEFVRHEYLYIHTVADEFDQKALTIKAWSVTLSMAGIGAAFNYKLPILLLLSSGASFLFWLIEAYWKKNQKGYYRRLDEIENALGSYFQGKEGVSLPAPKISQGWFAAISNISLGERMWKPHVFLPHLIVVLCGILLWVVNQWVIGLIH